MLLKSASVLSAFKINKASQWLLILQKCWNAETVNVYQYTLRKTLSPLKDYCLKKKKRVYELEIFEGPLLPYWKGEQTEGMLVRQMFNFHCLYLLVSWLRVSTSVSGVVSL